MAALALIINQGTSKQRDMPLVFTDKGIASLPPASGIPRSVPLLGPLRELRRKGFVDIRLQEPCIHERSPTAVPGLEWHVHREE